MSDGLNDSMCLIKYRGKQQYAWNEIGFWQRGAKCVCVRVAAWVRVLISFRETILFFSQN